MSDKDRALSPSAVQAYYDWFGKKQDSQDFYEGPALDELIAHAKFQVAQSVFELGCGTGKFAARVLENYLPPTASYLGCDISPIMIGLAKQRIDIYTRRAQVVLSDGSIKFPLADQSIDRVIANYVLDLLSDEDIRQFFSEARRTLVPDGKVCLTSLTRGVSLPSRIVSSVWTVVFRLKPAIVGGCRPILFDNFVDKRQWRIVHQKILTPFGVPSEVLILNAKGYGKS